MEKNIRKPGPPKKPAQPSKTPASSSAPKHTGPAPKTMDFAFTKENYRLMLIGLASIALGFILMIGGGSKDPNGFSYDIFNFQRLTLAPILVIGGYVVEIFAIMKKPKN